MSDKEIKVEARVPSVEEFKELNLDHRHKNIYELARGILNVAAHEIGPELAVSMVMSGIITSLRKNIGDQATIEVLRGYMETIPVAKAYEESQQATKQ